VNDKDGAITFNIAQNDAGSSILTLPAVSEYNCILRESVIVPARTIGSLLRELGWNRVDLIKMDIEGAEVQVLNSLGPEVLGCVGQITIEFHSDPVFGFQMHRQVEDCLKRMQKLGFLVIDFTFPARVDVLMINTNLIKVPLKKRLRWQLMYNPPRVVYSLLRSIVPASLRKWMGQWRRSLVEA
jgi:hypothetical protein